jgi:hypothetical protein
LGRRSTNPSFASRSINRPADASDISRASATARCVSPGLRETAMTTVHWDRVTPSSATASSKCARIWRAMLASFSEILRRRSSAIRIKRRWLKLAVFGRLDWHLCLAMDTFRDMLARFTAPDTPLVSFSATKPANVHLRARRALTGPLRAERCHTLN